MLSLVLIVIATTVYWVWSRATCKTTEPPMYSGGWPLVGHASMILGDSGKLWKEVTHLVKESHEVGGVIRGKMGPITVYFVTDPDDCFTIINTCLKKDRVYDLAKPWLGNGLLTGKVATWKGHRKILNHTFSQAVIDSFMGVFNSQAQKLVNQLSVEAGKGPFNFWIYARRSSLETICLTALGVDLGEDTETNNKFVKATDEMLNLMVDRFQRFWLWSPYTFRWSNLKKRQDECIKILHNMSNTVLQRKKSEFKERKGNNINPGKTKAFMDLLLEISAQDGVFNDREIREHVDVMIVGGHDTVANVMLFTMILLGSHPEVQERAYAEIQGVLGDVDRDVDKYDLSQLVYLEALLKESMRFYTIVPVVGRWLDRDVKLKNYTLSAGRTCFLLLFGVHNHSIWGPDGHEFKPERWLDPGKLPENPNAFAAFSFGRRVCIGKAYAYMSIKTTLAYLLRRYRISADHTKVVLKLDAMLKAASGYYISIDRRT